jgi:hypothetical protein
LPYKNKEDKLKHDREYSKTHLEQKKLHNTIWRLKHPEYEHNRYLKRKAYVIEQAKKFNANNPEKVKLYKQRSILKTKIKGMSL